MAIGAIPPKVAAPAGLTAVGSAIAQAAHATGVSFDYLLATAKVESGFNPNLAAKTSSARGLFQFIEQTWLGTLKQSGAQHGYGRYADAITRTRSGRYVVADPALRREILNLRKDPAANAVMAGVFTQQNGSILAKRIGRPATEGELYVAHFLGAGGAARLIGLAAAHPQGRAADVFPQAAGANRSIFYDRQGQPRSISGVYAELVRRYDVARAAPSGPPKALAAVRLPSPRPQTLAVADTAAIAKAYAAVAPEPVGGPLVAVGAPASPRALEPVALQGRADPAEPIFRTLYRPPESRAPVAQVVSELWGVPARLPRAAQQPASPLPVTAQVDDTAPVGPPLDLFQNMRPDVRALFSGGKA